MNSGTVVNGHCILILKSLCIVKLLFLVMLMLILTSIHVSFNILHPFHRRMVTVSYQGLNCVLKTNNTGVICNQMCHRSADTLVIHLHTLQLTKRQSTFAILRGSCIVSSNCRKRRLRSSSFIPSIFYSRLYKTQ